MEKENMTIEQVRERKAELEKRVTELVDMFTDITGLEIECIVRNWNTNMVEVKVNI